MTDNNDTKTTKQLLAEIEALEEQLAARGSDSGKSVSGGSSQPIFSVPITRRQVFKQALVGWVSPVILSVPLAAALLTKPGTANAQAVPPTPAPAPPTSVPTVTPSTSVPTTAPPTVGSTAVPIPGLGLIGIAALGSALAATGSKLVMDRIGAAGADESENSGGSEDDSGSN